MLKTGGKNHMLLKMLKEDKKYIYIFTTELILLLASIILLILPKDVYNVPIENSDLEDI